MKWHEEIRLTVMKRFVGVSERVPRKMKRRVSFTPTPCSPVLKGCGTNPSCSSTLHPNTMLLQLSQSGSSSRTVTLTWQRNHCSSTHKSSHFGWGDHNVHVRSNMNVVILIKTWKLGHVFLCPTKDGFWHPPVAIGMTIRGKPVLKSTMTPVVLGSDMSSVAEVKDTPR